jgi:hypothetical protein
MRQDIVLRTNAPPGPGTGLHPAYHCRRQSSTPLARFKWVPRTASRTDRRLENRFLFHARPVPCGPGHRPGPALRVPAFRCACMTGRYGTVVFHRAGKRGAHRGPPGMAGPFARTGKTRPRGRRRGCCFSICPREHRRPFLRSVAKHCSGAGLVA